MRPKQSGSGLIEVLVAVVVLSVGLLSIASGGLHLTWLLVIPTENP